VDARCEFADRATPDPDSPIPFFPLGCVSAACEKGQVLFKPDPVKVHDDNNACTADACQGPFVDHSAFMGKPCQMETGDGFCSSSARCVECISGANCLNGAQCVLERCVEMQCGLSCGGTCVPCPLNQQCNTGHDCASGVCEPSPGTCAPGSCPDMVLNNGETDVDCGGASCSKCSVGRRCAFDVDCVTGLCLFGICQFTCADSVKNGTETGVDCGGPSCPACSANAP
jgi:hypothetical protein